MEWSSRTETEPMVMPMPSSYIDHVILWCASLLNEHLVQEWKKAAVVAGYEVNTLCTFFNFKSCHTC